MKNEKMLFDLGKVQVKSTKRRLNLEELENVNGGVNLFALLMAALTFNSPIIGLGNAANTEITRAPETANPENMDRPIPSYNGVEIDESGNLDPKNIYKNENTNDLERIPHDEFLKAIDGSNEVNATAAFVHDTMKKENTWNLSEKQIQQAASSGNKEQSEAVKDSLEFIKTLPTDKKSLEAYKKIEVDKYKKELSEFLAAYETTDLAEAADKYCNDPDRYEKPGHNEAPENISRDTVVKSKEAILTAVTERFPEILDEKGFTKELSSLTDIDKREKYLDQCLAKFNSKISDYERARLVHNWVTENIAYNFADTNVESCQGLFRNHAEQVFKNSYGLCRGYARLTELFMRIVDVPCTYTVSIWHAFNAIFIKGEWFLIDTTWDSYKKLNIDLYRKSRDELPASYKKDKDNNQVNDQIGKMTQDYFPLANMTAETNNEKFVDDDESHDLKGIEYRFDVDNGICKMGIRRFLSDKGDIKISGHCIVEGEVIKIPEEVLKYVKQIDISEELISKMKRLHIPNNIDLAYPLNHMLNQIEQVTVDPENPYYGASEGLVRKKNDGSIIKMDSKKVHIAKDTPAFRYESDLSKIEQVTVDPKNPHYGASEGLVWRKSDGSIIKMDSKKVHIAKDTPELQLDWHLKDVEQVTVDPENPYYECSNGIVRRKSSGRVIWETPKAEQVTVDSEPLNDTVNSNDDAVKEDTSAAENNTKNTDKRFGFGAKLAALVLSYFL